MIYGPIGLAAGTAGSLGLLPRPCCNMTNGHADYGTAAACAFAGPGQGAILADMLRLAKYANAYAKLISRHQ